MRSDSDGGDARYYDDRFFMPRVRSALLGQFYGSVWSAFGHVRSALGQFYVSYMSVLCQFYVLYPPPTTGTARAPAPSDEAKISQDMKRPCHSRISVCADRAWYVKPFEAGARTAQRPHRRQEAQ